MQYSETLVLPDDQVFSFKPSRGVSYDAPFGQTINLEEVLNPFSLRKGKSTVLHLLQVFKHAS